MLIFPEIILLDSLKMELEIIRKDYRDQADKTKTKLYKLLYGHSLQKYNMLEQGVAVFIQDKDNPRYLDINLFYNANRQGLPTVHITLPAESEKDNGIGIDEGFADYIKDETVGTYTKVYTRRFNTTYNIVVTSDNTNEVVLMYHVIRSFIISLYDHLSLSGFSEIKLGGGNLNSDPSLVPLNIYMRNISLSFSYDVRAIDLENDTLINDIQLDTGQGVATIPKD